MPPLFGAPSGDERVGI